MILRRALMRSLTLVFLVGVIVGCGSAAGANAPAPRAATALPEPTFTPEPTLAPSTVTPTATSEPSPTTPPPAPTITALPAPTETLTTASTNATVGGTNDAPAHNFTLDTQPIGTGFTRPVYMTPADDGTARFFVVEQAGRIRILDNGRVLETPFLDIRDLVNTNGNERGLLSVAFHPDYRKNGLFYVYYTAMPDGADTVARYQVSNDPNVADPNSAKVLLAIPDPEWNHNGGLMKFGPDGYLYIGIGDGGGGGDRHGTIGNGQNLNVLLGKMLRIDVNKDPYGIPPDNPFVNRSGAKPEIWAYGLRNPWRYSFDRQTGDLYIADVGQGTYEEIDFQPAGQGGLNFGWRIMEGAHCYNPPQGCNRNGLTLPVAEYSHDSGCSVTGGYVYRGKQYPWLDGQYLFADYCTGIVWSTQRDASGTRTTVQRGRFDFSPSSFGEDSSGELYVVGHNDGTIYKLTSAQ